MIKLLILVLLAFAVITWFIYDSERKEMENNDNDDDNV